MLILNAHALQIEGVEMFLLYKYKTTVSLIKSSLPEITRSWLTHHVINTPNLFALEFDKDFGIKVFIYVSWLLSVLSFGMISIKPNEKGSFSTQNLQNHGKKKKKRQRLQKNWDLRRLITL